MENQTVPTSTNRSKKIIFTILLYGLWFGWVAVIHPLKITDFVDRPTTEEDIQTYATVGSLVKALLIVGPYWGIRSFLKKL